MGTCWCCGLLWEDGATGADFEFLAEDIDSRILLSCSCTLVVLFCRSDSMTVYLLQFYMNNYNNSSFICTFAIPPNTPLLPNILLFFKAQQNHQSKKFKTALNRTMFLGNSRRILIAPSLPLPVVHACLVDPPAALHSISEAFFSNNSYLVAEV
jgi:hypothetical protein